MVCYDVSNACKKKKKHIHSDIYTMSESNIFYGIGGKTTPFSTNSPFESGLFTPKYFVPAK